MARLEAPSWLDARWTVVQSGQLALRFLHYFNSLFYVQIVLLLFAMEIWDLECVGVEWSYALWSNLLYVQGLARYGYRE